MLTPEQVQKIDWFFESNGLELYDLRMELVDHVSEAIEGKMQSQPGICFEQAFEEETGKFNKKIFRFKITKPVCNTIPSKNGTILQAAGSRGYWLFF